MRKVLYVSLRERAVRVSLTPELAAGLVWSIEERIMNSCR